MSIPAKEELKKYIDVSIVENCLSRDIWSSVECSCAYCDNEFVPFSNFIKLPKTPMEGINQEMEYMKMHTIEIGLYKVKQGFLYFDWDYGSCGGTLLNPRSIIEEAVPEPPLDADKRTRTGYLKLQVLKAREFVENWIDDEMLFFDTIEEATKYAKTCHARRAMYEDVFKEKEEEE